MNFSTNQVMQFYALEGVSAAVKKYPLENAVVVTFTDTASKEVRVSDKIENVIWGKLTTADALAKHYKEVTITMDSVVEGADYVVRVSYPEVAGLGVEGWTTKTAVAHAKKGALATDIYKELADALAVAFKADGVLEVSAEGGLVIYAADVTKNYKKGVKPVVLPDFEVYTNLIEVEGEEVAWATKEVGEVADVVVPSGYAVSEMEWFALGERGDQYRDMGYPYHLNPADYRVIPTKEYDVLVVHYAFKGANEGDYKSEKDLIIVGGKGTLDTIATNLSKATGVAFTKVDATETVIATE